MKKFDEAIMDFLKDQVSDSIRPTAKAAGINPDILYKWILGQRSPSLKTVGPLLDYLGVTVNFPDKKMIDYDLVPKVVAKAGAGASLETDGDIEGLYAFRKDYMCMQHISAKNAVLMDVVGDSMEPLFQNGSTILIDKSDVEVMDGHIYVVTLGDELRVKRVQKTLKGLILRSENPKYADIPVEGPDLETFVVHGRVRWYAVAL